MTRKTIFCCACSKNVTAHLTNGAEVYPHRKDLHNLPFWRCDTCRNWVGCHHKTKDRTKPLGNIPTPELKKVRGHIHRLIDPLWKSQKISRGALYRRMSEMLGWKYHTAELRSVDDARKAYECGLKIRNELT